MRAESCSVFLTNKVKEHKEQCVKTDFYSYLNYLYPHGDGKSKKKNFTAIAVTARHSMSDGMLHVGSYSFTKASQDPL